MKRIDLNDHARFCDNKFIDVPTYNQTAPKRARFDSPGRQPWVPAQKEMQAPTGRDSNGTPAIAPTMESRPVGASTGRWNLFPRAKPTFFNADVSPYLILPCVAKPIILSADPRIFGSDAEI
jgi:hypothetical protein